jgi:signal transduction histidine kinase
MSETEQHEVAAPGAATQVEQLLALNRAAVAITGELELDTLLQRIVDSARELVGCRYAALGVLGRDGYIVRFPTSGLSATEREQIGALPRGHGLLGVMLRAGRSLRIPDMSKDPRRSGFPPNHPPMTSLLGVPIFVQGQLMGDVYLTDKIGGPEFSEEDEWLVQLLATHASTALTNAQLHEQVRRERARSQALLRVTEAINRSVELEAVIRLIVQSTVELLDVAGAAVFLVEPPSSEPVEAEPRIAAARYAVGLEGGPGTQVVYLLLDRSVAGRSLRSNQTQVVADTRDEPDIVFPRLASGKELRSLVAVPMTTLGGEHLGALGTYADRPDAFDDAAVQMLEAFAAGAATALTNARLYDEAQRGREAAEHEQQRLRELEQMKDEFLSTAAHELRTPLTTIRMSAGLALEQVELLVQHSEPDGPRINPRLIDLMRLITAGSERMHALVNDLLDLTRLEQGRTTLVMNEVDLREVVDAAVSATGPLFASKNQKVSVHLPEAHYRVRGDRGRLEQVLINLLSNAHKYSPGGTRVEVRGRRVGNESQIMVRDNGPGVPEDEREQIFARFYRSTQHREGNVPGTGLGLPIARTIAELHRGRLWVEPAPGGGSIFTLALPIVTGF